MSSFPGQRPDEEVVAVCRRHAYTLIKGLYPAVGGLFVAIAGGVFIYIMSQGNMVGWIFGLVFLLLAIFHGLNAWLKWYYSFYLITNQRIRWQSQRNMFRKDVIDVDVSRVQNARYNILGVLGSFLGFGTITIQTEAGDLVMTDVADCEKVYDIISDVTRFADKIEVNDEQE